MMTSCIFASILVAGDKVVVPITGNIHKGYTMQAFMHNHLERSSPIAEMVY